MISQAEPMAACKNHAEPMAACKNHAFSQVFTCRRAEWPTEKIYFLAVFV
jgi:hypothetical protein